MVREDSSQTHGPRMQKGLVAEAAHARMTVYNLDLLTDHDVAKNGEKGEHRRHGGLAVNHEKRDMVYLETISQVADSRAALIGVRHNDDLVAAIDKFRGKLVNVTFNAA